MKLSLISILLLLILQFNSAWLFSQDQEKKSYKNNLTFNITRLALMEACFGYERQLSDRHALRITLGLEFSTGAESFRTLNITPFFIPIKLAVTKGIYVALGYNYYFNSKKNTYVSAEVYYNYRFYNNKYFKFCTGQSKENYVNYQSMDLKKSGMKLLIGKKISVSPKKDTRLQFDFFAGLGIQYRAEEITIYKKKQGECSVEGQYDFRTYDPPEKDISYEWWPTIHGGLLLSLPF